MKSSQGPAISSYCGEAGFGVTFEEARPGGSSHVISSFDRIDSNGLGRWRCNCGGISSGVMDFDSFKPQMVRHSQEIRRN